VPYVVGGVVSSAWVCPQVGVEVDTRGASGCVLRFFHNFVDLGVAFKQLPRLPLCLAVTLYGEGQAVTLLRGSVDGSGGAPLPR
jgi:hypothetical protein